MTSSVFTTLLVLDGQARFLKKHLKRLRSHAAVYNLYCPADEYWAERIPQQGDARVRLSVHENNYIVDVEEFIAPQKSVYNGVSVFLSSIVVSAPDCYYKTGNYEPYRLARQQAEERGDFEGLLTDKEGYLVDGSRTSLIVYEEGKLISLSGGLGGITRENVLEYAKKIGMPTISRRMKVSEIKGQLLLAGTGVGLVPVGMPVDGCVMDLIKHFLIDSVSQAVHARAHSSI